MREWRVNGWNGTEKIYEETFRHYDFTDRQMEVFLQRLLCRQMTEEEVAHATRRRRKGEGPGVLKVSSEQTEDRFIMSVGDTPNFTAVVMSSDA